MMDDNWSVAHRERALTPDRPILRGTAQNPDVFFQLARPAILSTRMPDNRAGVMDKIRRARPAGNTSYSIMWAHPMPKASSS